MDPEGFERACEQPRYLIKAFYTSRCVTKKRQEKAKKTFGSKLFTMAETQNCEEKKRFWVQPLLKSRNRAEEFHLLTGELHHGRSWAYFRMSVGV